MVSPLYLLWLITRSKVLRADGRDTAERTQSVGEQQPQLRVRVVSTVPELSIVCGQHTHTHTQSENIKIQPLNNEAQT